MAEKIASLYAEISGDTTKLQGSLKQAKGGLTGFAGQLNDTLKNLTGFGLGSLTVAGGVMKLGKFVMDATNETQAYNLAMVDMARKMGTTTEEASKLAQVGDDVRLSQEQISTAMNFAIRNGVQPNIEGLATLADKYISLEDPVAKGQLLLKTFGRSGMEMGKLLEQGGGGIRSMADGIESGLIVTEQAAEASKKYYAAIDKLNDAWTAVKMNIGNAVIPALTDLIDGEGNLETQLKTQAQNLQTGAGMFANYGKSATTVAGQLVQVRSELKDMDQSSGFVTTSFVEMEDAMYSEAVAAYKSGEVLTQEQEVLIGLSDQTITSTEDIRRFAAAMAALKSKVLFVTTYTQTISLTGSWLDAIAQEKMKWRSAKLAAMDEGTYLNENPAPAPPPENTGGKKRKKRRHATGASFSVPYGYEDDDFPVYAKTGEKVDIKPAGQPEVGLEELLAAIRAMPSQIARSVRDAVLTA